MNQQAYIDALIELHEPLERQGPGDKDFSVALMKEIQSHLPTNPKMLDLGAGSGVATLLLAQTLGTQLQAVDFSETFIGHLEKLMIANGIDGVFRPFISCSITYQAMFKGQSGIQWQTGSFLPMKRLEFI